MFTRKGNCNGATLYAVEHMAQSASVYRVKMSYHGWKTASEQDHPKCEMFELWGALPFGQLELGEETERPHDGRLNVRSTKRFHMPLPLSHTLYKVTYHETF